MHLKYVGTVVTIIYLDRQGRFTQRRIRIKTIQENRVKAYDLEKRVPRIFHVDQILAFFPDKRTA